MARAYGWDVTLVRIVAVLVCIFSSGLLGVAYIASWIGIPEETQAMPVGYPPGV
jgi:phage shock protein PspC (stress-responsive transcriptional regulator)